MNTATASPGVYLITAPGGLFKIGESKSPSSRLESIDPSGLGMAITHVVTSGARKWLESYLHLAFRHRRSHREWFRLDDEEIALVRSIPAADSVADLPPAVVALWEKNRRDAKKKVKGERGRPTATGGKMVRVYTSLMPSERDFLVQEYGSVWAGLRAAVQKAMAKIQHAD